MPNPRVIDQEQITSKVVSFVGVDGKAQRAAAASPLPVVGVGGTDYETIPASATNQMLGTTGAIGDLLLGLLIVPGSTTAPGAVSIKDGSGNSITVFSGGSGSVTSLVSFNVAIGATSVNGGWSVTTGPNVSVFATGEFT